MLRGMKIYLPSLNFRRNKLTVLLESSPDDDSTELIILQQKGEAIESPVVPASRSVTTIFYDIQRESNRKSTLRLLASTEDIPAAVSENHYQVASSSRDILPLIHLGDLDINLDPLEERSDSQYCVEAVQVSVHEGHNTATAQAILLAPHAGVKDDWTTWGLTETMSIDDIAKKAEESTCPFIIHAAMKKTMFSVDYESVVGKSRKHG